MSDTQNLPHLIRFNTNEHLFIKSNLTFGEIEAAYNKALESIGTDICKAIFDYGFYSTTQEYLKILVKFELINSEEEYEWEANDQTVSELYLKICKLGNESFEYEWTEIPTICF